MRIEKIYVYPVKALRAVELNDSIVTKHGFPYDRRFMLVHVDKDKDGSTIYKNIHVAHYPESILFHPSLDINANLIHIDFKPPNNGRGEQKTLDVPLKPATDGLEMIPINMHLSEVHAYKMPKQYSDWFTSCYGFEVALVYLGPNYRPTRMSQSPSPSSSSSSWLSTAASYLSPFRTPQEPNKNILTFNDCAPYLICSTKSLQDIITTRLTTDQENLDIQKFRPNILISGAAKAWDEDFWSQITISNEKNTRIECIHNCGRCTSINIDYRTGKPGENESGQVLRKLQRDRRVDVGMKYSPIFGRYSFLNSESEGDVISVGDEVVVSRRNGEHTKFDWEGLHTLPKTVKT
ncbi:hypothetical protein AC578_4623 [Pseudocercospora eumusae]|uniref:MOSC domain-containing protein n=1 Tax=Pseudocercospora eumusae TaxID=321146 RepID=A0A139GZF6_9PEZI|nr:hypothetical protein AC578_4623 [Pseudocercospora eumusae]